MSITYDINKELNGIEIKFSEKPTAKVLARMKELGFRWNPKKFVWYAKNTDERLEFAKSIEKSYEQMTIFSFVDEEPKAEPQTEEPKEAPKKAEEKPRTEVKKVVETIKQKATPKAKKETKAKAEPKAEEKAEPKKNNVIEFAKARPKVNVRMALDETATLEECKAKIEREKAIFKDSSSYYVLEGLLKMCEASENFRANFMRENKTYMGAFKYFMNLAKEGYAHRMDGVAYLDDDLALGMAMDYYNSID